MKFWIVVLVVVIALAAWGWAVDRRRTSRGGSPGGETGDAARRAQGRDASGGAAPRAGDGF